MAESFAIVASAIQLADIGARTALLVSRLASRLRHAREDVRKAVQQLEAINQLAIFIRQTHATHAASHTPTSAALNKCIQDCFNPIRDLENMLDPLVSRITDRRLDRALKAVLMVQTKSQIENVVSRIEIVKTNLILCLCSENYLTSQSSIRTTGEFLDELRTLSLLLQNLPSIDQRVQSIEAFDERHSSGIQSIQNSLDELQNRILSSEGDARGMSQTVNNLASKFEGLQLAITQQNTGPSDPPITGTAEAQGRAGSLHLTAVTERVDVANLEGYVRNLVGGYFQEHNQSLISESRREIRGWVSDSMESGFSSITDTLASDMRKLLSEHTERSQIRSTVATGDPPTKSDESTQTNDFTAGFRDERWEVVQEQCAPEKVMGHRIVNSDPVLDRSVVYRSTPLGLVILRIERGIRWQRVEFTFHPIKFVSRGLNLSFELRFDARGFPMFRGGELYTYGIIDMKGSIGDTIRRDDIAGLREALQSKTIAISDRGIMGMSLLHVAILSGSKLIVEELVRNGIDLEVLDNLGLKAINYVLFLSLCIPHAWGSWLKHNLEFLSRYQTLDTLEFNRTQFETTFSALSLEYDFIDPEREHSFVASKAHWVQTLCSKGLDVNHLVQADGSAMLLDLLGYINWHLPKEKQYKIFEIKLDWITALLLNGADPSACDRRGRNALHVIATVAGRLEKKLSYATQDHEFVHKHADFLCESITMLLAYGCDPMAEDQNGVSSFELFMDIGISFLLAPAMYAFGWAGTTVTEFMKFVSKRATGTSVPHSQLPTGVRQRSGYRFQNEASSTESTARCLSPPSDVPKLPAQLEGHYCNDECPYEWPISWVLLRHFKCPKACRDSIESGRDPGLREVLLRAHLQGEDWEDILAHRQMGSTLQPKNF